MTHRCSTLLISCIDFRFQQAIDKWIRDQGLENEIDRVSIAGAAKSLARPSHPRDREFILEQIEISLKLHKIKKVILLHHEDCGAYGGSAPFSSSDDETQCHGQSMTAAKRLIQSRFPSLDIDMGYGRFSNGSPVIQIPFNPSS